MADSDNQNQSSSPPLYEPPDSRLSMEPPRLCTMHRRSASETFPRNIQPSWYCTASPEHCERIQKHKIHRRTRRAISYGQASDLELEFELEGAAPIELSLSKVLGGSYDDNRPGNDNDCTSGGADAETLLSFHETPWLLVQPRYDPIMVPSEFIDTHELNDPIIAHPSPDAFKINPVFQPFKSSSISQPDSVLTFEAQRPDFVSLCADSKPQDISARTEPIPPGHCYDQTLEETEPASYIPQDVIADNSFRGISVNDPFEHPSASQASGVTTSDDDTSLPRHAFPDPLSHPPPETISPVKQPKPRRHRKHKRPPSRNKGQIEENLCSLHQLPDTLGEVVDATVEAVHLANSETHSHLAKISEGFRKVTRSGKVQWLSQRKPPRSSKGDDRRHPITIVVNQNSGNTTHVRSQNSHNDSSYAGVSTGDTHNNNRGSGTFNNIHGDPASMSPVPDAPPEQTYYHHNPVPPSLQVPPRIDRLQQWTTYFWSWAPYFSWDGWLSKFCGWVPQLVPHVCRPDMTWR